MRRACALAVAMVSLAGTQLAGADEDALARVLTDTHTPLVLSTFCAMWLLGDDEMSDTGRYGLDAIASSAIACKTLKLATQRARPSQPGSTTGFPSGHATSAFTFARVLSHQYPRTAPYVYSYAAATAWSRVHRDRHSWLQVLAGAALGTWLANESLHHDGGLLFGLIAPDHQPGEGSLAPPMVTVSVEW